MRHKVFVSHLQSDNQSHKDVLAKFGENHGIFLDQSMTRGISDERSDARSG